MRAPWPKDHSETLLVFRNQGLSIVSVAVEHRMMCDDVEAALGNDHTITRSEPMLRCALC